MPPYPPIAPCSLIPCAATPPTHHPTVLSDSLCSQPALYRGSASSAVFPLSSPGANNAAYTVAPFPHSLRDDNFLQAKELLFGYGWQAVGVGRSHLCVFLHPADARSLYTPWRLFFIFCFWGWAPWGLGKGVGRALEVSEFACPGLAACT